MQWQRSVVVLSAVLLAGCGSASTGGSESSNAPVVPTSSVGSHLADDSKITYVLRDASVPPDFHRSVTVTVTKDTTKIAIDSYGDVLAERTAKTPPEVWLMLDSGLAEMHALRPVDDPKGCTGGTGRRLAVETGGTPQWDLSAEFCGGSNSGLDTRIDLWILPARALFPSTEELAPIKQA
jgi:hypothetical protein